ncbi:MAG: GxxExxY protein, partial [Bacteroidales bacterium]|nr:GxxExxY protein [Bacteroidales bacterium]
VELKAVAELNQAHGSQVINYLHATNMPLGLILNFGEDSLVRERYANFKIIPPAIVEKANQILNKKKG